MNTKLKHLPGWDTPLINADVQTKEKCWLETLGVMEAWSLAEALCLCLVSIEGLPIAIIFLRRAAKEIENL